MTPHTTPRGLEVARFCRALQRARGDHLGAAAFAAGRGWSRTAEALEKAAVSPLTTTTASGAVGAYINDLAAVLRAGSIIGRLPLLRRADFNTRLIQGTDGSTGGFVDENAPAPVSELALSEFDPLRAHRCAALTVLSAEAFNFGVPGTDEALAQDITAGCREALDRAFVDPANAGAVGPASVTYNAPRFAAPASPADIDAAIRACLGTLTGADCDLSTAMWIMSPKLAAYLSTARGTGDVLPAFPGMTANGGALAGLPVVTSRACVGTGSPAEELLVLVEQREVGIALGDPEIMFTTQAAVRMDTAPTSPAQLVSLWQHGLVGFRCTQMADWRVRRAGAVAFAVINGVL